MFNKKNRGASQEIVNIPLQNLNRIVFFWNSLAIMNKSMTTCAEQHPIR
ncbi:hypothetical protein [Paenibacillus xylanexedens]|nr:hypothetical protein [Paenibacillus xylanexedens]